MAAQKPNAGGERPGWVRYSGIGVEFAAAVAGIALVGLWVDHRYDTAPWGVVIGAGLGLIGGTYNLIRKSIAAFSDADRERRDRKKQDERS